MDGFVEKMAVAALAHMRMQFLEHACLADLSVFRRSSMIFRARSDIWFRISYRGPFRCLLRTCLKYAALSGYAASWSC
jgi:hypothetical protein